MTELASELRTADRGESDGDGDDGDAAPTDAGTRPSRQPHPWTSPGRSRSEGGRVKRRAGEGEGRLEEAHCLTDFTAAAAAARPRAGIAMRIPEQHSARTSAVAVLLDGAAAVACQGLLICCSLFVCLAASRCSSPSSHVAALCSLLITLLSGSLAAPLDRHAARAASAARAARAARRCRCSRCSSLVAARCRPLRRRARLNAEVLCGAAPRLRMSDQQQLPLPSPPCSRRAPLELGCSVLSS